MISSIYNDVIDDLINAMSNIPDNIPWEIIQYALICERLLRYNGCRTKAAKDIDLSLRAFRVKLHLMRDYGFKPKDSHLTSSQSYKQKKKKVTLM